MPGIQNHEPKKGLVPSAPDENLFLDTLVNGTSCLVKTTPVGKPGPYNTETDTFSDTSGFSFHPVQFTSEVHGLQAAPVLAINNNPGYRSSGYQISPLAVTAHGLNQTAGIGYATCLDSGMQALIAGITPEIHNSYLVSLGASYVGEVEEGTSKVISSFNIAGKIEEGAILKQKGILIRKPKVAEPRLSDKFRWRIGWAKTEGRGSHKPKPDQKPTRVITEDKLLRSY